jgi:hypothetical protein
MRVLDQLRDEPPCVVPGDHIRDPEPSFEVIGEGLSLEDCLGLCARQGEHELISTDWRWRCQMLLWRARQDSNLRPSAPEADALSAELQARDRAPVRRREAGLYSLRPPEDPETSKRLPKEPLRMLSR